MTAPAQFVPDVSDADIERIVTRDFLPDSHALILQRIRAINVREKPRVILACLKNAQGNLPKLHNELDNAEGYWREIITEAEYPKYGRIGLRSRASAEVVSRAIESDKRQYLEWLLSESSDCQ